MSFKITIVSAGGFPIYESSDGTGFAVDRVTSGGFACTLGASGAGFKVATKSGGGPSNPSSIFGSNLVAWWNPADSSTVHTTGSLINQIEDKSGNGFSLTATGTARPAYGSTSFQSSAPGVTLDGSATHMAATVSGLGGSVLSAFVFGQFNTAEDGSGNKIASQLLNYWAATDSLTSANTTLSAQFVYDHIGMVTERAGGDLSGISTSDTVQSFRNIAGRYTRYGSVFDGTNNTFYADRVAQPAVASTASFDTSGAIGYGARSDGFGLWTGVVGESVIIKGVPTTAQIAALDDWFLRQWNRVLVTVGDSIIWTPGGYPGLSIPNLTKKTFWEDIAIAGSCFSANPVTAGGNQYSDRTAEINARIPSNKYGKDYILYINYSNNLGAYNNDANTGDASGYAAALGSAAVAAKTAGFNKVLTGTVLSRTDVGQANDPLRNSFNSIITGTGWAAAHGFDGIVDIASDPIMGVDAAPTVNPSYFLDQIHPNAAGHARLEPYFTSVMNAL